ncbi:MAG: F-type H+-transporting ATPase subunit alpha, partial [Cellvibrionaceae bacterium]
DRLTPVTAEFQLAWLIAFNDRLFDTLPEQKIASVTENLGRAVATNGLTLDTERDTWSEFLRSQLQEHSQ